MLRKIATSCFVIILCLVLFPGISADVGQGQDTYDILIKNAKVFDGSGSDAKRVDVAIQGDTIAKVGSEGLLMTAPIVLYGLLRYLFLLHRDDLGGSPTQALLAVDHLVRRRPQVRHHPRP